MAKILPSDLQSVMTVTYFFNFAGTVIGIILCSLLMPLPNKDRPLPGGIILIAIITSAQFIIRGFGVEMWINSVLLRACLAVFFGVFSAVTYGLFFLSWLRNTKTKTSGTPRTGRYCSLIFAAALTCGTAANIHSAGFLKPLDPMTASALLFDIIKWILPFLGVSSALTLIFLKKSAKTCEPHSRRGEEISAFTRVPSLAADMTPEKTNQFMIVRLLGLASVFTILNGVMELQLFPLVTDSPFFRPNYIVRALIILILGFLAGRNINFFIAVYLIPVIGVFIMMSCLPLLRDYSLFIVILSTLVTSYHHSSWAVFSTAVVENYYGNKYFYGVAVSVQFCSIFSFFSPLFSGTLHGSPEFIVLYSAIAATVFALLSFRVIFPALLTGRAIKIAGDDSGAPDTPRAPGAPPETENHRPRDEMSRGVSDNRVSLNDFLEKYNLSKREIDVAKLMINEGVDTEDIAERLFISLPTVKTHITRIYRKFNVKKRAEFMALFLRFYAGPKD